MKSQVTAHMVVRNEEQWVWYAINSVIDFVDRLLVYDTGSTDRTVSIVKLITNPKINCHQLGDVSPSELVELRNRQIEDTRTNWFMLLDGDEVWPKDTIEEFVKTIMSVKSNIMGIVIPTIIPVGDLFHYQPESAGKYRLMGKVGQMNLRGYKKQQGWQWEGIYPLEAYVNKKVVPIQQLEQNLLMLQNPYWHLTYLRRSTADTHGKRKLEIGEIKSLNLPKVFFSIRPNQVPSPWISFSPKEKLAADLMTPLLRIKRRFR